MSIRGRHRGIVAVAAAAGCAFVVAPANATFPGANGRVAFSWAEVLGEEPPFAKEERSIRAARIGGRRPVTLRGCVTGTLPSVERFPADRNDCSIEYLSPAWSPNGRYVAFDAGTRVGVMRSDGSGFRLLRQVTADDGDPAWSPDGRKIVLTGTSAPDLQTDLYVIDLITAQARRLTYRGGRSPDWSSRNRIAFVRGDRPFGPGGPRILGDLYTVRPGGKGLRRLTQHGAWDPSWSPHANRVAFTRGRPGRFNAYSVRARGGDLRRIRIPGANPERVVWSPDGRWIAYEVFDGSIYARPRGSGRALEVAVGSYSSQGRSGAIQPAWQPRR